MQMPCHCLVLKRPLLVPWLLPQLSSWNFILSHLGGVVSRGMPTKASMGSQFQEMAKICLFALEIPKMRQKCVMTLSYAWLGLFAGDKQFLGKSVFFRTSGGFQDPQRVYSSPAGSLHPGTDKWCPERLSKGLGTMRDNKQKSVTKWCVGGATERVKT